MQRSIHSLSFKRRVIEAAIAVAGLDPAHIVGQGYDGAVNVSGKGTHHSTVSRSSLHSLQKPRSQLGDCALHYG